MKLPSPEQIKQAEQVYLEAIQDLSLATRLTSTELWQLALEVANE